VQLLEPLDSRYAMPSAACPCDTRTAWTRPLKRSLPMTKGFAKNPSSRFRRRIYNAIMPTRRRRVFLAGLAGLALSIVLVAGCSSNKLPDATNLLNEAAQTAKELKSIHLAGVFTGVIPHVPVKTMSADVTNTPAVAARGKGNVTIMGQNMDIDFVVADGKLYVALRPGKWTDFGPAAAIYDPTAILKPDTGLANLLKNFTDAKSEARENVAGVNAVRVTGKVNPGAVNAVMPQIGATAPLPGTVWIREDGNHDLVGVKVEPSPSSAIQIMMSDWGKPITVTAPSL
jgi:lipoprotein LprG